MEILFMSKPKALLDQNNKAPTLSKREHEILLLVANQLTMSEIAAKLFISRGTVETHRRNIMNKLAVKNTAGLMIKSIYLNLVTINSKGEVDFNTPINGYMKT